MIDLSTECQQRQSLPRVEPDESEVAWRRFGWFVMAVGCIAGWLALITLARLIWMYATGRDVL